MKEIIIKKSEIFTPLGNLEQTVKNLFDKKSAVVQENVFGLDVSIARLCESYPRAIKDIVKSYAGFADCNSPDTLFIFCSAKGDINKIIDEDYRGYSPVLSEQAKQVAEDLCLDKCKVIAVSNACAAGSAAIDTARLFLRAGKFARVVIFGFEQASEFVVKGFNSLKALSPSCAKPFDKNRDGMSLGEGGAILVLELGELKSDDVYVQASGASNDANHRTGPSRTGDGLALAISRALNAGCLCAKDIAAVKCHATATAYNDAMEAKALSSVFGQDIPNMVALKAAIGHLSGAGSLVETIISAQFLTSGKICPTLNFEEFEGEEKIKISGESQEIRGNRILCLSAGFGGINAAVVLAKA